VSDAWVGLDNHGPGVAVHTAELFRTGMFSLVVFTGANVPTLTFVTLSRRSAGSRPSPLEMEISLSEEHGRVFREAWIAGVKKYYPGEPKASYITRWMRPPTGNARVPLRSTSKWRPSSRSPLARQRS
jgi:hypothetical protein